MSLLTLVPGKGPDPGSGLVEGRQQGLRRRRCGGLDVLLRYPKVVQAGAVEALGELDQGPVAPLAHRGDDLPDRVQGLAARAGAGNGGIGFGSEVDSAHTGMSVPKDRAPQYLDDGRVGQ